MRALNKTNSILLLVLLLLDAASATQSAAPLAPEKIKKIEAIISSEMSRQRIPGLSIAIVIDNHLRWSNGYGFADVENFVPAKATTVYRLASISKPITAVAAMQLAERGKLDLDAPIQKYVPSFPPKPWPITARHLLSHTGGIRAYNNIEEVMSTRHYNSLEEALDIFKNDPLLFEPGTKLAYSTYGYVLLGRVIEGASGMTYIDYVRENIFRPAGMNNTHADDVFAIIPNRAQGYKKNDKGELKNSPLADTSNKIPAGGLCSTVDDIARFAVALQKGLLIKPETTALMWTHYVMRDGKKSAGGLGWPVTVRKNQREVWHSGAQQRVSAFLYLLPDARLAVVVMANLEDVDAGELARKITDAVQE